MNDSILFEKKKPYQRTPLYKINRWSPVMDGVSERPYEQMPVIDFLSDQYFKDVLERNGNIVKVRISDTNGRYDGDYWSFPILLSSLTPVKSYFDASVSTKLMLFSPWESYPFSKENGNVRVLAIYERKDIPLEVAEGVQKMILKWRK